LKTVNVVVNCPEVSNQRNKRYVMILKLDLI